MNLVHLNECMNQLLHDARHQWLRLPPRVMSCGVTGIRSEPKKLFRLAQTSLDPQLREPALEALQGDDLPALAGTCSEDDIASLEVDRLDNVVDLGDQHDVKVSSSLVAQVVIQRPTDGLSRTLAVALTKLDVVDKALWCANRTTVTISSDSGLRCYCHD